MLLLKLLNTTAHITRLNKPTGILLLWWPVAWALWLASNGRPDITLLLVFSLGVLVMRSAGCIINDIFDRNFDARVKRTAQRPLAQKSMSVQQALGIFIVLIMIAAYLLTYLNNECRLLAIIAAGMTVIYPLCKRITYLPQLFLGMTFNMGVLMVFAQVQGQVSLQAWILYTAAVCWTLAYDTLYAMQDMQDDQKIGVKSTALLFKNNTIRFVSGFYLITLYLFYTAVTLHGPVHPAVLQLCIGAGLLMIIAMMQATHQKYHRAFNTNIIVGAALFAGIALGLSI